jgi:L-ascorbate 6-phosphate lactonase
MRMNLVPTRPLGQVGFRFDFGGTVVYVDPYLSDSVREQEGEDLRRLVPIPILPQQVRDADHVLITHSHRDHCDLDTLTPLATASPQATFVGPPPVIAALSAHGFPANRIKLCRPGEPIVLTPELSITCVPSAHPTVETDEQGNWLYVGFLLDWRGRRFYHAGDTALTSHVFRHLQSSGRIHVGFLPVNEINFFRDRRGIIGNMSIRDAFGLAEELGIDTVVPTHWDMFEANQVFPEEIELLYAKLAPKFKLLLRPSEV